MFVVGSFVHWRTLAPLATIPALLQLLLLFFIPESLQWLEKFGCEKELEAALLCLRGDKADISHEAIEIKDYVESLKIFSSEGILDIFQKKYVWPLLTVAGVLVLMNLGGINALTYYSGAIFVSADIEGAAEDSISSSWKSQGLALLQVERYLMLHSMVIHLSRN
ncbi:hypothetical protein ES319_A02G101500v1 [Gossypium barbadense]|uniref:Major facilitator superfamily (MFS) profile domain-containing protein n=1 Tax=Gossypium barbadense TaxID=3634 RepID=A0A5J5WQW1_GOSBA|nr:hypothetical protein ES319_A02G101500v1 [Gossypium barbadense]